jgi:hypothetical protein
MTDEHIWRRIQFQEHRLAWILLLHIPQSTVLNIYIYTLLKGYGWSNGAASWNLPVVQNIIIAWEPLSSGLRSGLRTILLLYFHALHV